MEWTDVDTWIATAGVLTAVACAIPGVFLLLNRQSMLGDAISHAVLPGLAIAFFLSGSRELVPLLAGAVVAGVSTTLLSEVIRQTGRVEPGAALGVVFTTLFAAGLVLVRLVADKVHLDPACVLYGSLELAVLDGSPVPPIVWRMATLMALNLVLALVFGKELQAVAFDERHATACGLPAKRLRLGLTMATAVTAVLAFESVGSILTIAMLIVPAATAFLICRSVWAMFVVACLVAAAGALGGHLLAIGPLPGLFRILIPSAGGGAWNSAGVMSAATGLIFFGTLFGMEILRSGHRRFARGMGPPTCGIRDGIKPHFKDPAAD